MRQVFLNNSGPLSNYLACFPAGPYGLVPAGNALVVMALPVLINEHPVIDSVDEIFTRALQAISEDK